MQHRILNQVFSIQDVNDEADVKELAGFVEERMTQLQRASNIIDSHRLAMLTAFQIADEYFQLRKQHRELNQFVGRKSAEFVKILDQFTDPAPKRP